MCSSLYLPASMKAQPDAPYSLSTCPPQAVPSPKPSGEMKHHKPSTSHTISALLGLFSRLTFKLFEARKRLMYLGLPSNWHEVLRKHLLIWKKVKQMHGARKPFCEIAKSTGFLGLGVRIRLESFQHSFILLMLVSWRTKFDQSPQPK